MEAVDTMPATPRVVRERHGRFVVRRVADVAVAVVLEQLLSNPDELFRRGQRVDSGRPGGRRDCMYITVAGQAFFIKRYNCLGWRYRIRHFLRPSRALRSWRAGLALLRAGVRTPVPQLCLEERTLRLLGPAYLVCEGLPGAVQLLEIWPQFSFAEQREALMRLAEQIGSMHQCRIIHGDINWRNILVQDNAGQRAYYFVDLDGSRRARYLKAARAERDIGHFIRDLRRCGGSDDLEAFFLDRWRKQSGLFCNA